METNHVYHGISVKAPKKECYDKLRRLKREQELLEKLGWTWQLMLSNQYNGGSDDVRNEARSKATRHIG